MIPTITRVAVFWNTANPAYGPVLKELESGAPSLGIEVQRLEVRGPEDFEPAFAAAAQQRARALIMPGDPLTTNRPRDVADLAHHHRLPSMMEYRGFVEAGGLVSCGANIADLYRRSAAYVDKILNGANPAELPVEQTTKLDLIINLQAACALGLTIPRSVLEQTTKVIE